MAMEYDLYDTVNILLKGGADPNLCNDSNSPAIKGLDGSKSIQLLALSFAKTTEDSLSSLIKCQAVVSEIDKATYVSIGLKTKKNLGDLWTKEVQEKFKEVLNLF
jgi:hypothetical protein